MIQINLKLMLVSMLSVGLLLASFIAQAEASHGSSDNQFGPTSLFDNTYTKKLMDMDVVNNNDEKLGMIDDLVLNDDNKIVYAIVSVGGFLGVGDKLVAVPFENLRVNNSEEKIRLDVTKEQLEQASEFKYKR